MGAPLGTVINAFGGRWYDENWVAQLNDPDSAEAIRFYIELLQNYGPRGCRKRIHRKSDSAHPGSVRAVVRRHLRRQLITDPATNPDYEQVGFAYGPSKKLPTGNWLWSWNFAMAANSDAKEAALAFMMWATSTDYVDTIVATDGGWGRAPTGARASSTKTLRIRSGRRLCRDRSQLNEANPNEPTEEPVPYTVVSSSAFQSSRSWATTSPRYSPRRWSGISRSMRQSRRPTISPTRLLSTRVSGVARRVPSRARGVSARLKGLSTRSNPRPDSRQRKAHISGR